MSRGRPSTPIKTRVYADGAHEIWCPCCEWHMSDSMLSRKRLGLHLVNEHPEEVRFRKGQEPPDLEPARNCKPEMRTVFSQKEHGGQWYWHTEAKNGKIVADGGEGYHNLNDALHGFLVSQDNPMTTEELKNIVCVTGQPDDHRRTEEYRSQ